VPGVDKLCHRPNIPLAVNNSSCQQQLAYHAAAHDKLIIKHGQEVGLVVSVQLQLSYPLLQATAISPAHSGGTNRRQAHLS
jgi:hypothetical protein